MYVVCTCEPCILYLTVCTYYRHTYVHNIPFRWHTTSCYTYVPYIKPDSILIPFLREIFGSFWRLLGYFSQHIWSRSLYFLRFKINLHTSLLRWSQLPFHPSMYVTCMQMNQFHIQLSWVQYYKSCVLWICPVTMHKERIKTDHLNLSSHFQLHHLCTYVHSAPDIIKANTYVPTAFTVPWAQLIGFAYIAFKSSVGDVAKCIAIWNLLRRIVPKFQPENF
jgi:hypothetical protein